MSEHVAVLGAGNIAQALAAHLAIVGNTVKLYNPWEHEIAPLRERGGIELSEAVQGFGKLSVVSTDIEQVVPGAKAVFVATPAYAHRFMAEVCAPCLTKDQVVLLHPATFGSTMEFARYTGRRATISETDTSLYIARIWGPGSVRVLTTKTAVRVAAFPARDTAKVIDRLTPIFPGRLSPAVDVLDTGVSNSQAAVHCPVVLFNFSKVESGAEWLFYQGITEGAANFIEAMDIERVALGRALGLDVATTKQRFERGYNLSGKTLLECLHYVFSRGGGAKGPADRNHRYIFEDIPYAAVPWASMGRQLGVPMPATEALIASFSAAYKQDLWAIGRTAETMGLAGLSSEQIQALARDG